MATNNNKIRVVELFAGVGGFRLGLEGYKGNKKPHHKFFETVWFNQWEPSTKKQHAHETYVERFGYVDEYTNTDIAKVVDKVPVHDLLVGGFPCQDYFVEWRIVNAAEYGFPQRRKRTFILAYKKGSEIEKKYRKIKNPIQWLEKDGVTQNAFPAAFVSHTSTFKIPDDPVVTSQKFNMDEPGRTPFFNSGVACDFVVHTGKVAPIYEGEISTLGDILIDDKKVPEEYYIKQEDLEKWAYLKGPKEEKRKAASGYEFIYKEGGVTYPDNLKTASRTIITGEGGTAPSRFKHVVKTKNGLRRLTPIELERLCMFPDNHTAGHGDTRRAFFMGNALVVGVIDTLGKALAEFHFEGSLK